MHCVPTDAELLLFYRSVEITQTSAPSIRKELTMNCIQKLTSIFTALCIAAATIAIPISADDVSERPPRRQTDCLAGFPLLRLQDIPNHIHKKGGSGKRNAVGVQWTSDEAYVPLLVISVGFRDLPYDDNYDIAGLYFNDEESVTAYYHDQSFGKFTYLPAPETSACQTDGNTNRFDRENDGVVHVTLDRERSDWSTFITFETEDEDELNAYWQEYDASMRETFAAAIQQTDDYVDFAAFDKDGSGTIETSELAICFAVSGFEASAVPQQEYNTADRTQYFWSVAYSFAEINDELDEPDAKLPAPDGTAVDSFIAVPEFASIEQNSGIETICHELGHYLGLPDLYDTDYAEEDAPWYHYDIDLLSIMSGGSYQYAPETDQCLPASFDIWSKWMLGWVDPQTADVSGIFDAIYFMTYISWHK